MAWSEWQINAGVSGIKAIGSFIQQSRQAANDKAWQKYNNAMVNIQDKVNQNNITTNQNMAVERQVREKFALNAAKYQTEAKAEVASAAMGVEGNSVDMVMRDIASNESRMQSQLDVDMNYQLVGFKQQRKASALQATMAMDHTQIPKPNFAQSLLEWGAGVANDLWSDKLK